MGTGGDVYPALLLGRTLQPHGFQVTLITNPVFAPSIQAAGLGFAALGTVENYMGLIGHPDVWHPKKAAAFIGTYGFRQAIHPLYDMLRRFDPGATVMLAPFTALGARLVQEQFGTPLLTTYLQPANFYSVYQMPRFAGTPPLDWLPRQLRHLVLRAVYTHYDSVFLASLNTFRRNIGLADLPSPLYPWLHSPHGGVAWFPHWFAPPQPDWPTPLQLTGFLLHDSPEQAALPAVLETWLDAGNPPIVFTAGTAMLHGHVFFARSLRVCQLLGRRGILVTRYPEQLPHPLPANVRHVSHAPFRTLLPRAAALVHHGGIGTVAQGLAAGIPQLVMPLAHDQPDNAARLERLRVGQTVLPHHYTPRRVARMLQTMLQSQRIQTRCREVAGWLDGQHALSMTCDAITRMM